MNNVMPDVILDLCDEGTRRRGFDAAALFLDISGFTPLTEALMRQGEGGAELLADIVNEIFRPVIAAVYARSGYVSGFAGDAFTAVFPAADGRDLAYASARALAAAQDIRALFAGKAVRTPTGDFPLAAKLGLASGAVEIGIVGGATRRAYYYRGPAIDACARAEQGCEKGGLAFGPGFAPIPGAADGPAGKAAFPSLDPAKAAAFYPRSVLESEVAGEFRRLASLFVSFRDLSPEELDAFAADLLREVDAREGYFNRLDFGDKGGNALVLFGAPAAHEDDLDRALQCALFLRRAYESRARCGVTFGRMYFGRVGIPERCEYTALGSEVNFSARLMTRADWGQILVPESVARHPAFAFARLGEFPYKGLPEPVATWQVERQREARETFFAGALVGREAEERALAEWAAPVAEARPGEATARAALIYGEAGMGKSRLAFALRQALGERTRWLIAQADPILRQAFNPFVYLLRGFFDQSPDATAEENLARFEARHRALVAPDAPAALPEPLRAELLRTRPFLGALLNLRWPDSLYERLGDAKLRYENTLDALAAFVCALGRERPLVVELEDAHALDDSSREVLGRLTRRADAGAVLLLVTSRYADDGAKPPLGLSDLWPARTIELGRLPREALRELASLQLGGDADDELLAFLESRAEGVPFYAQQMLLYLRETDAIEPRAGEWRLRAETSAVPDTLGAMLVARLDRLAGEVKKAVQTAAVLGLEFDVRLLSRMLRADAADQVLAAERGQIWSAVTEIRYLFKHALLREAAYDMQLRARLRSLHGLALEACEAVYSSDLDARCDELAFHADRAGLADKQRLYFRKAGEAAKAGNRNAAALDYFSRLLPLLEDGRERREALLARGEVLEILGRWDEAEADYRAALALADSSADPGLTDNAAAARSARMLGKLHRFRGDFDAALEWLARAKETFGATGDRAGLAAAKVEIGAVLWQKGDYPEAKGEMEGALALARELSDSATVALALNGLGNVSCNLGDLAAAQRLYGESLEIRRKSGDKRGMAALLNNLGALADYRGDFDAERALFEECLATMREIGDRNGVATGLCNLGTVLWSQGDCDGARSLLGEGLAISRELGNRQGVMTALGNLGNVAAQQGDYRAARELHEECLALTRELGHKQGVANTLHNLGNVAFMEADYARAGAHYRESLALGHAIGERLLLAHDLYALAAVAGRAAAAGPGEGATEERDRDYELARRAAILSAASGRLVREVEGEIDPFDVQRYAPAVDAARRSLGEEAFAREQSAGEAMGLDEVVRYATEEPSPPGLG